MTKRTRILLLTMLAVPAAFGLVPARADDQALVWGKAVDGFQVAISLDSTRRLPSGAPALRLHFRNTGNAGRNVRLNLECERPEGYRSDLLTLLLKDSSGKSERLADTALCSGRRSYFDVPLPPGTAYSLPLDLDYHRALTESGMAKGFDSPTGTQDGYTLQAVMAVDLGQELLTATSNDLVVNGSKPSGVDQGKADWGAAINGLQMAISPGPAADTSSRLPAITLHLHNVGANDLRVTLGGGCGPTKDGLVNGVTLNLTDLSGNRKQLTDVPSGPGCAGGVWIFLVPMAPGAMYSVPLELEYYKTLTVSRITRDFERGWEPGGTYALQAVLTLRPDYMYIPPAVDRRFGQSWAGTVTSQGLEVHFPTQ